jgi:methionyl-tRNA formyltransferase
VRIIFFGTPEDAVPALRALHAAGHEIALVVTQPDRRRGRGSEMIPSPVKAAAEKLGIPVRTPARAKEVRDEVVASGADVGVVVAFGQILPESLFTAVPLGFVNVHFSLLPRWRGAAPVERAILAGDDETGVCIMAIAKGLDTGDVYARAMTPIAPRETAGMLRARLVDLGTDLLLDTLPKLSSITPEPQSGEPTYADKLTVDEFELDWAQPAEQLDRVIRAGNPRPGAWTTVDGKRLKILAATIDEHGVLVPEVVQPEGRGEMTFAAWHRGRQGKPYVLGT